MPQTSLSPSSGKFSISSPSSYSSKPSERKSPEERERPLLLAAVVKELALVSVWRCRWLWPSEPPSALLDSSAKDKSECCIHTKMYFLSTFRRHVQWKSISQSWTIHLPLMGGRR
ncbi:hypothetical protein U1Q18_014805 [Sarracenia purpurea var. burkii]